MPRVTYRYVTTPAGLCVYGGACARRWAARVALSGCGGAVQARGCALHGRCALPLLRLVANRNCKCVFDMAKIVVFCRHAPSSSVSLLVSPCPRLLCPSRSPPSSRTPPVPSMTHQRHKPSDLPGSSPAWLISACMHAPCLFPRPWALREQMRRASPRQPGKEFRRRSVRSTCTPSHSQALGLARAR